MQQDRQIAKKELEKSVESALKETQKVLDNIMKYVLLCDKDEEDKTDLHGLLHKVHPAMQSLRRYMCSHP
jgi:hypothetical protein